MHRIDRGVVCLIISCSLGATAPAGAASFRLSFGSAFSDVCPAPLGCFSYPAVSPDGRWAVWAQDVDVDDQVGLWSARLVGGAPIRLSAGPLRTDGFSFSDPKVTPDSQTVVFLAELDAPGRAELYKVPIAGPEAQTVKLSGTVAGGGIVWFLLAPNGQRAVYLADTNGGGKLELFSVPLAGGTAVKLNGAIPDTSDVGAFLIAPNSSRVVFQIGGGGAPQRLWSAPIQGGAAPVELSRSLVAGGDTLWAQITADSSSVVYLADAISDERFELFRSPIAGPPVTAPLNGTLAAGGDVTSFAAAANSATVAFVADRLANDVYELFSVPLAGGTPTRISAPLVAQGDVNQFAIAPDSARALYQADQEVDGVLELYSVPLGGGAATKLNGALPAGGGVGAFWADPTSARVLYVASDILASTSMFTVPIAGGASTRLSPTPTAAQSGSIVTPDSLPPTGGRIHYVYRAYPISGSDFEALFASPVAGGTRVRMSPQLLYTNTNRIWSVRLTADGKRAVYVADQTVADQYELYVADLCIFCDGVEAGTTARWSATQP